ncbi:MAG: VWA domain-containing protein [Planctomycetota bacterium]
MTRYRLAWFLALVFTLGITPSVVALPKDSVDKETKDARRALKKNLKIVYAMGENLEQLNQKLLQTSYKDEAARKALEQQIEDQRTAALQQIPKVAAANDDKAALALMTFAIAVNDQTLYERSVEALGELTDEEAIALLVHALEGPHSDEKKKFKWKGPGEPWHARMLAASALEYSSAEPVIPAFLKVLEKEENPHLFNRAIAAVSTKEDPRVIESLITCLGRVEEAGGWEYFEIRDALTKLTGEDFYTQAKWEEWWKAKKNGWSFDAKGETKEAERDTGTRVREVTGDASKADQVPTFFGSQIESNRVLFVLDCSGSMIMTDMPEETTLTEEEFKAKNPDEPEFKQYKRIERAKKATIEAVKALQPTQHFNIIAFSSNNQPWKPGVVPASDANKQEAVAWLEGRAEGGGTRTLAALQRAFEDEKVDTIFLLSDGAPQHSNGKLGNPGEEAQLFAKQAVDEILEWVRINNRFRGVRIYTFGMDGPGVWHKKWTQPRPITLPTEPEWLQILTNFMRQLASMNNGDYKSI